MNPHKHSELSCKKRGGQIEDYYPLHSFMDSTKELCSDNRHRILHTHWGIRRIVIPIFGPVLKIGKKSINVKDLLEEDHILPDYRNKFIPTLNDFVDAIDDIPGLDQKLDLYFLKYATHKSIAELMLSPLHITGKVKSLLITHNSWFCNCILPKIFEDIPFVIEDHSLTIADLFQNMNFKLWMDNGATYPPSANKMPKIIK